MVESKRMSRREREIMDILYSQERATVRQIQELMDSPPTVMAIRRMLQILEEKGHLLKTKEGRESSYSPKVSRKRAGASALKHVIDTFFSGALDEALAAHFTRKDAITPEQLSNLLRMIDNARVKQNEQLKDRPSK